MEVIVKYSGNLQPVSEALPVAVEILDENYAILTLEPEYVPELFEFAQIQYVELPKMLTANLQSERGQTCVSGVQFPEGYNLDGSGVLIAILDSGIDYTHPDFRNEDGSSRILFLWDQTAEGTPPAGFQYGTEYTQQELNAALQLAQPLEAVPEYDSARHGTAIAGIAAGNGRASDGRESGVAPKSSLLIVKLGTAGQESFSRTTELMRAIKYAYEKAAALNMPLVINISYGTNNGAHNGASLFETFVDDMAQKWKSNIIIASGNEASAGHHFHGVLQSNVSQTIEFVTAANLPALYISLWLNFTDNLRFELIAPNGNSSGVITDRTAAVSLHTQGASVYIFTTQPTHYSLDQEVFFWFEPDAQGLPEGVWRLVLYGQDIADGQFDIWLPTVEEVTRNTAFLSPSVDATLTLPSTALNAITVGGYQGATNSFAEFSGRGNTRGNVYAKPDLVAPATGIITTKVGGGYDSFTGTSVAAPFVTGAVALMMQWGIVNKNDPYLYGQRVKAFLHAGATRSASERYPNPVWGYGTLCLKRTMDLLVEYQVL